MNPLTLLARAGKAVVKLADTGAKLNAPILSEIDRIADIVKNVKVRSGKDRETLNNAVLGLKELKISIKPGTFDYKRFKLAITNGIAVVLIYAGLPMEIADHVAMYMTAPVVAFIVGDSIRPSRK